LNREIRLAKSMVLEAMLLGAALSQEGDREMIMDAIKPGDLASVTMRKLMEALADKDKDRFSKIISRRYGVIIKNGERALPAIVRTTQYRAASEAVRGLCAVMLETVQECDSLTDITEMWQEGIDMLRRVAATQEERTNG